LVSRATKCSRISRITKTQRALKWSHVEMGPPDPILGITVAFKNDTNKEKMNLGVGAYRDDNGHPFVLECVKKAEEIVFNEHPNHEYAPIGGTPEFGKVSASLLFGEDCAAIRENRIATVQSISGTGALRVVGEFLKKYVKNPTIFLPSPTWANHIPIFKNSGLSTSTYKYYNGKGGLDFQGMTADFEAAPSGSAFLLHACAHNPTGVDPTNEQWRELAQICKKKST